MLCSELIARHDPWHTSFTVNTYLLKKELIVSKYNATVDCFLGENRPSSTTTDYFKTVPLGWRVICGGVRLHTLARKSA